MAEAEAWVVIPKVKNKGTECVLDMRPIVLCKNCKWRGTLKCSCPVSGEFMNEYWFCASGVMKDD